MNETSESHLRSGLSAEDSSTRLQATLVAGTDPVVGLLPTLIERCAVEPDFYVRDMLTWALTRYPVEATLPALRAELGSGRPQARSQALHTLSKIGDPSAWTAITPALLRDGDDEVARSAWRAAVVLVPDVEKTALAVELGSQLGRGGREVMRSLSRAMVELGALIEPILAEAATGPDPVVRAHAHATGVLRGDPDAGFDGLLDEARREVALGPDGG